MLTMFILQTAHDTLVNVLNMIPGTTDELIKESDKWFNEITIKFLIRMLIDIVSLALLIRGIYYPKYCNKTFFLPFTVFNIVIFLITYLLNKVELSLGAAFGLFAVFGIIRYRSEDISINNLTYLFTVIAIGLISAIAKGSWEEISFYNSIILLVVYILESRVFIKPESTKLIHYDRIELLKPENRAKLFDDLKNRTGYHITKIEIERLDLLKDRALLRVYHTE